MGTSWSDALRRVATALGHRRRLAEGEEAELTDESGFTLIELMVVLVIMGILMAIAIPTFLGVTSTANDTSTQSNLANVITAAKAIYAKTGVYPATTKMVKSLGADEPEFGFTAGTTTKQHTLSILTGTTTGTFFAAADYMTKTHVCWVAVDTAQKGIKYGYITASGTSSTFSTCSASTITSYTATGVTWGTGNKWPSAPTGH
jgi:type IV pilus assembly protein PilA